jgi:hypothetical protein
MTWYKTGTVAVTPGSNAVIGTGTSFIANSRVGDAFRGPDGEWYEVTNIASDTALSIAPNYQGPTAGAGVYALAPMQGYVKDSADALRAATGVIASGVADMQEQVAAATEAAESAGQSKSVATEQAGIATSAANTSTENKDASAESAGQSLSSAQTSASAATRAEDARDSVVQSEVAAAESALAAKASADRAEEVTLGKAASGDNNDITSLRAITSDGFDRLRQGIAPMIGATASAAGIKGLVPVASIADRLKVLSGAGAWVSLPSGGSWGSITGTLSAQTDLQSALDAKLGAGLLEFTYVYPNGGSAASPASVGTNARYTVTNPFPGFHVLCVAELLINNVWAPTGNGGNLGTGGICFGTEAGQVFVVGGAQGDIAIQTGQNGCGHGFSAVLLGLHGGTNNNGISTAPCRVKVFKLKGVIA